MLYHLALEINSSKALISYGTYGNCAKSQRNGVINRKPERAVDMAMDTAEGDGSREDALPIKKYLPRNFTHLHIPLLIGGRMQTIRQGLATYLLLKNGSIF